MVEIAPIMQIDKILVKMKMNIASAAWVLIDLIHMKNVAIFFEMYGEDCSPEEYTDETED